MNERIRELADKSGLYIAYENREVTDKELEFFAELIVQECADVCERFGESGDGYTCSAEILEHFGVEE